MTLNIDCSEAARGARIYSSELTPLLQLLLSTLANIDFAFERDLEVVRSSTTDEVLKWKVVNRLHQQHRDKREPYLRQIAALEARISALLGSAAEAGRNGPDARFGN
jgi:hypothetical protein